MSNITTRASKGSALTHNEMDANWTRTVSQKVTTYQMLASDNRAVIEGNHATTPFTVTLPAVATAAAEDTGDFEVTVTNINAAVVSVDASGSETIDGSVSTIDLEQWESVTIKLDSADTGWKTIAQYQQKLRPIADTAAGDSAAVGYTAAEGLVLTGQGSGADVTIKNDADGTVLRVPTGTTNIDIRGNIDLGAAGNAGQIVHQTNGESIEIAGGAATTAGGGIFMYAADNSLFPGDVAITNDGNFVAHWDESAGDWTFFSGTGTPTEGLNLDLNQNLTVGNGTQAAPEVRINGAATADPALELQQDGAVKAYFQYQDSGDITRIDGDGQVIIASANTTALTIDTSQNLTLAGTITVDGEVQPKVKIVDIGDWNMDTTDSVSVAHGLTAGNIRSVSALIRNDANSQRWDFSTSQAGASNGFIRVDSANIVLWRESAGFFDGTNYNSTSFNRGWITIWYV